jgi:hypothetical protein
VVELFNDHTRCVLVLVRRISDYCRGIMEEQTATWLLASILV